MASFDFIECALKGYRFFADHGRAIFRLARVPFIVKLSNFVALTALGMDENVMRQGLLLLPSYFAEGWLVSYLVRVAILNDPWPDALYKQNMRFSARHVRGVSAGMIVYVLVKLTISFVSGFTMSNYDVAAPAAPEPTLAIFFAGLAMLAIILWAFRLLWIYIPAALEYSLPLFMKKTKGLITSFYMIGTWLCCFIPPIVCFLFFAQILAGVFPLPEDGLSQAHLYILVSVQAIVEMVIAVLASLSLAYGIESLYNRPSEE